MMKFAPFLAPAMVLAPPALAQSSVVIWPVDPQISVSEQATALWLENRGKEPVTLQVRSFAWGQANGEDRYRPQDAVVSSPPIARVGPGERQLIRMIRRAPDAVPQSAYRLLIDELPPPTPESDAAKTARISLQMRYSIPLFTYGGEIAKAAPAIAGRIEATEGQRWLVVTNTGQGHARLTDLRRGEGRGSTVVKAGLVGYVLPGATMRFALPAEVAGGGSFTIAVNGHDQSLGYTS